uniref:Uncharacterized protein n=1 Tax=Anguilla anguilla TaxID=7936 RepID=A0A0E9RPF1_ANGAN
MLVLCFKTRPYLPGSIDQFFLFNCKSV